MTTPALCAYCTVQSSISLLLFETYANVSSQICPFLVLRPEFHSNHCVNWSTPRYCQSATFGRLTFCVYTFFLRNSRLMSPRPCSARTPHPPRKPLCGNIGLGEGALYWAWPYIEPPPKIGHSRGLHSHHYTLRNKGP